MSLTTTVASYLRLKVLVATTDAPSATASTPSSSSSSSTSTVAYSLKKIEVPRTLDFITLRSKLISATNIVTAASSQQCEVCLSVAVTDIAMADIQLTQRDLVDQIKWDIITTQEAWTKVVEKKQKLIVRLSLSSSSSQPPARGYQVQPMIARKAPGPWPKFSPQPHDLPLIILHSDEREWEVVGEGHEEDEFEEVQVEGKSQETKNRMSAGAAAVKAAMKVGVIQNKPNRTVPHALLEKLTAGKPSHARISSLPSIGDLPPSTTITFAINGQTYTLTNPSPHLKLINYLRYDIGLTGQKIGCGEGGCGACTVLLSKQDLNTNEIDQYSTKACLHPVAALDGCSVTTTEGLGSEHTGLHPIQASIAKNWATQCGYCTPGFVMGMYGLLVNNPTPTAEQIETRFDGNLCRCTGYRPIFKAMRAAVGLDEEKEEVKSSSSCTSSSSSSPSAKLTPCGKGTGASCSSSAKSSCHAVGITCGAKTESTSSCGSGGCGGGCATRDLEDLVVPKYDPTNPKHKINPFPEELLAYNREKHRAKVQSVTTSSSKVESYSPGVLDWTSDSTSIWFEPSSLSDISNILNYYLPAGEVVRHVVGNTSIGVSKYYAFNASYDEPTIFINMNNLVELQQVNVVNGAQGGVYVGAGITISKLIASLQSISQDNLSITSSWGPLIRHIHMIANTGVRNVASWAGNLMIAKTHPAFPSDFMTILAGIGATLTMTSLSAGLRTCAVSDFPGFTFYVDEFIQQLFIPFTPANYVFDTYKIRERHQNAHPIINAAYAIQWSSSDNKTKTIQSCSMVIGGLTGAGIYNAQNTINYLTGKQLTTDTLAGAIAVLQKETSSNVGVGNSLGSLLPSAAYRQSLALTTFYKFALEQMNANGITIPLRDQSAYEFYVRPVSSGSELFTPDATTSPVGQPIPKLEGAMQASGEAKYTDDIALPPNGLWGAYFYSSAATGTIASIDASVTLAMPGVFRIITAADIAALPGGVNDCGSFPGDEPVFAVKQVTATGQAIGMVLADTRANAEAAAKQVVVTFEPNPPTPIITIADALAANPPSILPSNPSAQSPPPITSGNFQQAYNSAPNKLTGTHEAAGQAHFCMETQTCMAVPQENDGLHMYSSSQGPMDVRGMIMKATGLPANKVTVETRRTGGAFGSKLSRSHPIACATALAARITNRPIKAQTSRLDDMCMFGGRPDYQMQYQVGFDSTGKILAYNTQYYQRGGHTYENNFGGMSMCLLWSDNAYYIPNFNVQGSTCRTNTPSNTAMRGPGAFNSIWHIELVIEAIAVALNISPDTVRENNFYTEGQMTPYNQPVTNITMQRVWQTLQTQANYTQAKADVATFNAANKWRKRGVHMTAIKYGIGVPGNQVGILLNVMQDDGTIVVTHTGVELGQGINTKVAQTIAYELGIDISLIIIGNNATNIVANGSQTGGSATSESACQAAINACANLNALLAPIKAANPGATWSALIQAAEAGYVNLTVSGMYNIPPPNNFPFTYFVWNAGCSLVELDVLTGAVQVLRTDIVYDAGNALNPAVDIGQIEGAFVMGLGHYLTEGIVYDSKTGQLLTRGTWDYHPPSSQDIPLEFNVTLLNKAENTAPNSVLGSKATAEPPMMLSQSVFFAVRDCIAAVRADNGLTGWFDLTAPASTQTIQLACGITPKSLVL